jgi:hypothetical protein
MKKPIIWVLISLASFILVPVMPYFEGRTNSVWVFPPLLPADILPPFFILVSAVALFFCWIRSIRTKHRSFEVALMFCASLVFFLGCFAVDRADLYGLGFHSYAKNILTADEWRSISRFAQAHLKTGEVLHGPSKNLWDEKNERALWTELAAATRVQKLPSSLVIFVHPDCTTVVWGGALTGHRGVIIATGDGAAFQHGKSPHTRFITEDIATSIMD